MSLKGLSVLKNLSDFCVRFLLLIMYSDLSSLSFTRRKKIVSQCLCSTFSAKLFYEVLISFSASESLCNAAISSLESSFYKMSYV